MESAAGGIMSKLSALKGGLSTTHIVYLLAAVLFIVISVSFYYYYFKPRYLTQSYTPNSEHDQDSGETNSTAELMLFYVDWCPHCKTAKPDWDEVKAQFQNKTINGYQVVFTEINCTTETEEVEKLMNKYKVEGYPTIKLIKDGQVIEYDAKPSKDTLIQFLNTVL